MIKVLVVCLGNICRSPMAEGILRKKMEAAGLEFELDSAGTGNYHIGEHPDRRAIRCMEKNGIDISTLRARQITSQDLRDYDVIFAMDTSNYENIVDLANSRTEAQKVRLFLNETGSGMNASVPDPWFGEEGGFDEVFELLDQAANAFVNKVAKSH